MWKNYKELHITELQEGDIFVGCGKGRKVINISKDDRPFLINGSSCRITTSVDLFRYLFKREIGKILYESFLVELKTNANWFNKSKYFYYKEDETDAKKYEYQLECYWIDEIEARKFVKWFNENSTLR